MIKYNQGFRRNDKTRFRKLLSRDPLNWIGKVLDHEAPPKRSTFVFVCVSSSRSGGRWCLGEGKAGVRNVLRMMREEFELTMALNSCTTLADINRNRILTEGDRLRPTPGCERRPPPPAPHLVYRSTTSELDRHSLNIP